MITMEPKIQSTTSTRALRSKIGPIKAYLFKTSYVISPITPSDLKHSMKGAYKSFLSKTDQAYGHSTSTINPKLYPISTFKQMSLVVVPSFMIESPFEVVAIALIAFLLILLSMREHRHKKDILDTERNMALDFIADKGFDPQFGARPVKRVIQKYVLNELSKALLGGTVDRNRPIVIDRKDDGLEFKN